MLSADDTPQPKQPPNKPALCSALEKRLKGDARRLQKAAEDRWSNAIGQLRKVPELKKLDDDALLAVLQRRHALSAVAIQLGFTGWQHLLAVVRGDETGDVGTLLYPPSGFAYWNVWSASYEEASAIRHAHGGYLLPYKHQLFICDEHFVRFIGLDPDDERWTRLGRDLARPTDLAARAALIEQVIAHRLDA